MSNIPNDGYWRMCAEGAADELGLKLTEDQIQTLAAHMHEAHDMKYEATGECIATRNVKQEQESRKVKLKKEARSNLRILWRNLETVRVSTGDGSWCNIVKSDDAKRALNALFDYIDQA